MILVHMEYSAVAVCHGAQCGATAGAICDETKSVRAVICDETKKYLR